MQAKALVWHDLSEGQIKSIQDECDTPQAIRRFVILNVFTLDMLSRRNVPLTYIYYFHEFGTDGLFRRLKCSDLTVQRDIFMLWTVQ